MSFNNLAAVTTAYRNTIKHKEKKTAPRRISKPSITLKPQMMGKPSHRLHNESETIGRRREAWLISALPLHHNSCPLHISRSNAQIGPRCFFGFPTWHRLSGHHREVVGRSGAERVQRNCLSQGVVINKTPSSYQPTQMYALRAIRPM